MEPSPPSEINLSLSSTASHVRRFVMDAVRAYANETPAPTAVDGWVDVAGAAGVVAPIADVLAAEGVPLPELARLTRLSAAATSMRTSVELRHLASALDGLRWVVLKGPVLADVVYRTDASRTYDDLDALIHPADLSVALTRLDDAGFKLVDRNWPMIARMRRGEISLSGPTGAALDLHWHPVNDAATRSRLPIDVAAMLRDTQLVTVADMQLPSLGPADLVVYVALHASLSGGHRLRWLLDIHQAIRWSGLSPADIGWRARIHGLGLIASTMFRRVAHYIDPSIDAFADAAAPRSPWTAVTGVVSRLEDPIAIGERQRSGRSIFAATRRTSAASITQLVASLISDRRDRRDHRDASAEVYALHTGVESTRERERWLASAAAEVG